VFDDFDLNVRIANDPSGRVLIVEPFTIFAREDVTTELCDRGLHLVAPVLADAMRVEGHATLQVTEFSLPLELEDAKQRSEATRVRGLLRLDNVKTGLKNSLLQEIVELTSRILGVQVPQTLKIAEDTEVQFELRDGRVYHDGLVFLLPELSHDICWRTSGTVGLDETLDLTVQGQLPITQRLSERPFEFHVTGTVDKPKVELSRDRGWLKELIDLTTPEPTLEDGAAEDDDSLPASLLKIVGQALDELGDPERPTPLLDRIRERREAREKEQQNSAAAEDQQQGASPFRRGLFNWRRRRGRTDQ
jgi:hypothetical protein